METIETVIVGGGQAGMAASYYLNQLGREHVLLEKQDQVANAWRKERWDSFTLVTPNWSVRMPGAEYAGPDPHGFMPRDELVAYFDDYVERFHLPVQCGVTVGAVERDDWGYHVRSDRGDWLAKNVVMATGFFQQPKVPAFAAEIPADTLQITTQQYRNSQSLPPGAVLVVGSGQSGAQIAEELHQSGRKVFLAIGSSGRAPRRYRGKDINEWLYASGFFSKPATMLPSPKAKFAGAPHLTGKAGGHTLNLHAFYREGVILLGHVRGIREGILILAPDLKESLSKADQFEANMVKMVDEYIAKNELDIPDDELPRLSDGFAAPDTLFLDLEAAGVTVVIWALGYRFDYSLVRLPVCDTDGYPVTSYYFSTYPGLFFVGLPYLNGQQSGLLLGVAEGAAQVAQAITGQTVLTNQGRL